MEGGIFVLVVVLAAMASLAGCFTATALWLRGRNADPDGDSVEGPPAAAPPGRLVVENEGGEDLAGTNGGL
jgi:hypothetical protein